MEDTFSGHRITGEDLDSMFADYISEREGAEVYWTQEGFISFVLAGDQCLIRDCFVSKAYRGKGHGKGLYERVATLAKQSGCRFISCAVDFADRGAAETLKKLLAIGFTPVRNAGNQLVLGKEV